MSQSVCFRFVGSALVLISGILTLFAPTVAQSAVVSSTSAPDFASAQYISRANFSKISNPNVLDSTTIPYAVIVQYGRASVGRDYYRFSHLGGTVHLDIDSNPQVTNFDTMMAIWDAGGNLFAFNDDTDSGDPGDIPSVIIGGRYNSNLSNLNLAAGDYVVGVSRYPTVFGFGGSSNNVIPVGGTYTLNISSAPEPTSMAIFGLGALGMAYRARRKGMA
jgi:PEP-CTERM motif